MGRVGVTGGRIESPVLKVRTEIEKREREREREGGVRVIPSHFLFLVDMGAGTGVGVSTSVGAGSSTFFGSTIFTSCGMYMSVEKNSRYTKFLSSLSISAFCSLDAAS